MKSSKLLIMLFIILLIKSDDIIKIDVSNILSTTDDYIIERNTIILSKNIPYDITGNTNIYNIKVSSSCKITLNSLIISSPIYPAILIEENKEVNLILKGKSKLSDTKSNQYEGVIYLNEESKLIISGEDLLTIKPNKHMAINGAESTSLIVESGEININSTATDVGGIYLNKEIIFNNGIFKFDINIKTLNSINPPNAIDSEGSITIKRGKYYINSGQGKGLQAKTYIYIGNIQDNNDDALDNLELAVSVALPVRIKPEHVK